MATQGFTDAASYGFSPEATGIENVAALQRAVDAAGTIVVSQPGTYKVAGPVHVGSHTHLTFGKGVFLKKVDEQGTFTQVLINRGALTRTYDESITVEGLHVMLNGIDNASDLVLGLRGVVGFSYVRDLRIKGFRCYDLGGAQYAMQVSRFEDVIIEDTIIKGNKDGIHFGPGRRFTIRDGVFQTVDDAIAFNGQDYSTSNPELGWIEDGVVENCYDLDQETRLGYFCRLLGGGWVDWYEGMTVQQSDAVVSNGRIYRVKMPADETLYESTTRPDFDSGSRVLDGITWVMTQEDVTYTGGVRNVVFRDIQLEKPRIPFSIEFNMGKFNRSWYPGAQVPMHEHVLLDNVKVMHDEEIPLVQVTAPVNVVTIANSRVGRIGVRVHGKDIFEEYMKDHAVPEYSKTTVCVRDCVFDRAGETLLLSNTAEDKQIALKTCGNVVLEESFRAKVDAGPGQVAIQSDLIGLKG